MELVCCVVFGAVVVLLAQPAFCDVTGHEPIHATLIKRMDDVQNQLMGVTSALSDLDSDLEKSLYECVDNQSDLCKALKSDLKNRGSSASYSPAKRSSNPQLDRYIGLLQELKRKRVVLKRLARVFDGADSVLRSERKRSCNLNLGFHCQTEEISNFADMYDFLSSPMSPGKKRSAP